MQNTSRRQVLAVSAAVAGAVGTGTLAGCGGGEDDGGTGKDNGAGQSTKDTKSEAPPAGGATLVALDSVPVGSAVSAKDSKGAPLIVSRPDDKTAVAFSAICTHMGCTVKPAGKELHCPCHGSVYEAATGKNIGGPAPKPLAKVPVHVADGHVVTGAS
ncbi:MAG: Rieske (2Fe-2S) protein [Actinocatenispora sp.]